MSKTKSLYNPLKNSFTWNYAEGTHDPVPYTIPSLEIATFSEPIANHLAKHLAQAIVFERGIRTNYEDEYNEVLKEITVEL